MKIYAENEIRYTNVVFSGSTCCCRVLNHTSRMCGHRHKTIEAAERCLEKLVNFSKDRRSCSAAWAYAKTSAVSPSGDELAESTVFDDGAEYAVTVLAKDLCTC